jgi:hypothetical protein
VNWNRKPNPTPPPRKEPTLVERLGAAQSMHGAALAQVRSGLVALDDAEARFMDLERRTADEMAALSVILTASQEERGRVEDTAEMLRGLIGE